MDLYKINKKYSFFLLLFNIIFLISISKYFENNQIEFQYQTIICFFLISVIGVSHGALDHLKGYKLMKIYKVKNKSYFYLTYVAVSLIVIFTWMIVPEIVLIIFLIVASYHFGKEDSCVEPNAKSLFYDFLYLFKGNVIVTGRRSPLSKYKLSLVSFDEAGDYDQKDAEGFIKITSLRLKN